MTETTWLWIGTLGMLGGSVVLFAMGGSRTQDEEGHTLAHGFVPLFAAIAYFAMAIGQGAMTINGREFLFARYIDWSITTPVLLVALSMTALHGAHRRAGLVAGLVTADVVMILTGLFFGMSEDPFAKWTWYITSCVAFLGVYYVLFGPMRREAQSREDVRRQNYNRNLPILSILWLVYPVIVILGPDGLKIWSATLATACITVVDLVAKVVYGFIAARGSKQIADHDLAGKHVVSPAISNHAIPTGSPREQVR